jgi:uncharacterized RDD family membrane protein YckC
MDPETWKAISPQEIAGSENISIETPEQVALLFPLAGVGSRFLAIAMDTAIQLGALLALAMISFIAWSLTSSGASFGHSFNTTRQWTLALSGIGVFLVHFGYFATFEAVWQGQTPGKRYCDLRVLKDNGASISAFDAVGRNLMRIVDSIPGVYAIGVISVFLSPRNKRLGDYLAGTIVVYDKPLDRGSSLAFRGADAHVGSHGAQQLTEAQFQVLEAYTARKFDLEWEMRRQFATQIVERLSGTMEVGEEDRRDPDAFIERLVAEYRNR